MYKIEKGIEIPESGSGVPKYPWKEMEVGDSFFVKNVPYNTLHSSTSYAGSRYHMKFSARKVEGGYRIWRIE